jgi:hypothetical protein
MEPTKIAMTPGIEAPARFFLSRQLVEVATRIPPNRWTLLDAVLSPLSAVAFAFAFWRLSADIGWSAAFIFNTGFFSHWIPWFCLGLVIGLRRRVLKSGIIGRLRLGSRHGVEISAIDEGPGVERHRQGAVNHRKQSGLASPGVGYASALYMVQPKRGWNLDEQRTDDEPADRQRKIPA